MQRNAFLILAAFVVLTGACESRKSRPDRNELIPEDKLVEILTDTYLADGLLGIPRLVIKLGPVDSVATYSHLLEKQGYTREDLDKTMKYYFIKKPKKLIKIYDKVLGILSEMESRVQKELDKSRENSGNFWKGHESYYFPDNTGKDSTSFDIILKKPGVYTLTATVILFPDDQSFRPCLYAYSVNADSLETGKRKYIRPFRFIKDGHPHTYTAVFSVPQKSSVCIKGDLFDHSNPAAPWEKHVIIHNVALNHTIAAI